MSNPVLNIYPLGFPWKTADPFLFCVHHADAYPKGNVDMDPATSLAGRVIGNDFTVKDGWRMYHGTKVPGFPSHPHRGFETVTIVQKGMIDHSDSLGAAARFGNGDVQWMTAGKGVQHSEMFPLLNMEKDNPLELFQIWLNLPRSAKFADPHFAMFWNENIPVVISSDEQKRKTSVKIVAGTFDDKNAPAPPPDSWAAKADHDVAVWIIEMEPEANWTLPASQLGVNRNLYFFEGTGLSIAGKTIPSYKGVEMLATEKAVLQNGQTAGRLLLLQGKPINEPVVQHGPFVMNTEAEIRQTMMDYQKNQFGGWPWPNYEYVHSKDKGRFARYVDGTEEFKDVISPL